MQDKLLQDLKWNQWLAGVIDGDGCFSTANRHSVAQFSITMNYLDERCLYGIKQKIGGSVKLQSGSAAVRLRLSSKVHLSQLVARVNGLSLNSIRTDQLKIVCQRLGINYCNSTSFSWQSSYASGLFDSDGTVTISVKKHRSIDNLPGLEGKIQRLKNACETQLSIKITQKFKHNIQFLCTPLDLDTGKLKIPFGAIHFDKSQNGYYSWYITSRQDMLAFCNYIRQNPSRTVKMHRLRLIPLYYELWSQKPHLAAVGSALQKRWFDFAESWFKYS